MPHLRMCGFVLALVLALPSAAQVLISQIYGGGGNAGATLRNDFIELFNRGASAQNLAGWSVQYASATGSTWQVTSLTGSLSPGQYYLVQQAAGTGGTMDLPVPDAVATIAMSAAAGKVALVMSTTPLSATTPSGPLIADLVGYGSTASVFEGSGPAPGLSNTTAALRAGLGCTDTNNNSADFSSGAPVPRNTAAAFHNCLAPPPPPPFFPISQIQGPGAESALTGMAARTRGIVTARKTNGFFIQTPDTEIDADPLTSEGLFVFTSSTPPAGAATGNLVEVTGTVTEFRPSADLSQLPLTELTGPALVVLSTGNPLPAPIALTAANVNPAAPADQLERFEGMRVSVASLTVVAPTGGTVSEVNATSNTNGDFWGVLTGTLRPFREPGIHIFEPLPAASPCCLPRFDGNPEKIRIDSNGQVGVPPLEVATGAVIAGLSGPLDYGFRGYTILPDAGSANVSPGLSAAIPVPMPTPGEVTVASFNMQRFFDTANDPSTGDPVLTAAAFANRLSKASLAVRSVLRMPDIVAVQEIENLPALDAIAARINLDVEADNPNYQAFLVEGNDVGGIDSGFLVKSSTVMVLDTFQVGKDATFIDPTDGSVDILHDRPPLVLRARVVRPGSMPLDLTLMVNHFRSLTDIEDPAAGPRVRGKRKAQAEFVAQWLQDRQSADADEHIVTLGDFNAFEFNDGYADVVGTVAGAPAPPDQVVAASPDRVNPNFTNLIELLPAEERYSYSFSGDAQVLDHVLVNQALFARVSRLAYARSNADFPELLRNQPDRPERLSDHDMPVAYIRTVRDVPVIEFHRIPLNFIPGLPAHQAILLVRNRSDASVAGPVHIVLTGLPQGVALLDASGASSLGPYITISAGLQANRTYPLRLRFTNPSRTPITFTPRALSGTL